jgi:hypothetical protein
MTNPKRHGPLRRLLAALGHVLERAILGKASPAYMRRFAAGDEYWARALAARAGRPREARPEPGSERSGASGHTVQRTVPGDRGAPEPEHEPVHGWTRRQFDGYMARNPGYRPAYEAQLITRREKAGMSASTRLWFGLWGPRRITTAGAGNGCFAENARPSVRAKDSTDGLQPLPRQPGPPLRGIPVALTAAS